MDGEKAALRERIRRIVADMTLMDDDFMAVVLADPKCAQLFLQVVLERDDLIVREAVSHYEMKNLGGHSVILDLYAVDRDGKLYNIEIQRSDVGATSRRARYYSSVIDANALKSGEDYKNLPETYVIFVTENDVLKGGRPIYHIERTNIETGAWFGDGAHILYVNSQIKDDTPLGILMQDFSCRSASDMHYDVLAKTVKHYKETEEGATMMCRAVEQLIESKRPEWEKRGEIRGEKRGEKRGAQIEKKSIAKKLLGQGLTREQIAEATDLSLDEIQKIDAERK